MEVSTRTIYRDISDLVVSGVPIIGEAGVGYMLDKNHIVRPLMFEAEELDALMLGAEMVAAWGDEALACAAGRAIDKTIAIIPEEKRQRMMQPFLFSLPSQKKEKISINFTQLRRSINSQYKVEFFYVRKDGTKSIRRVRPLALACFAPVWLLLAWCEKRKDFRSFRVDRMNHLVITKEGFLDEKGKRLCDYDEVKHR